MCFQLADKVWFAKKYMIIDHKNEFLSRDLFEQYGICPKINSVVTPPGTEESDFMCIILTLKNKDFRAFYTAERKLDYKLQFYRGYSDYCDIVSESMNNYIRH